MNKEITGDLNESKLDASSFVDGDILSSSLDNCIALINPSNGQVIGSMPEGSLSEVNIAVASAKSAFNSKCWSDMPPSQKKQVMHSFADKIANHAELLDRLDAIEMGKPVSLGAFNAISASGLMRFYAEAIDKYSGQLNNSDASSFVAQRLIPRGVVAAIVPWNFPTYNAVMKIAPALAAGNSVVLKPSELSSQSAMRLVQFAVEAGLPPGVLNLVVGRGEVVGEALGLHDDINMITFTGSTQVGKKMLAYSSRSNMKKVTAECGGKSPQIVFADCHDLDVVADHVAQSITLNQGQVCSLGSRLLVEKEIELLLAEKIVQRLEQVRAGNAVDPSVNYGPLVSREQFDRVTGYIKAGLEDGGDLVCGGAKFNEPKAGYYIQPTAFINVSTESRIFQEEIFGPVLSIVSFTDINDAINKANGTCYGLAAYIWTRDTVKGFKVARSVDAAVTCLNATTPMGEGAGHAFSAEPYNHSGLGVEGGIAGLESFCRRHFLWLNHGV